MVLFLAGFYGVFFWQALMVLLPLLSVFQFNFEPCVLSRKDYSSLILCCLIRSSYQSIRWYAAGCIWYSSEIGICPPVKMCMGQHASEWWVSQSCGLGRKPPRLAYTIVRSPTAHSSGWEAQTISFCMIEKAHWIFASSQIDQRVGCFKFHLFSLCCQVTFREQGHIGDIAAGREAEAIAPYPWPQGTHPWEGCCPLHGWAI